MKRRKICPHCGREVLKNAAFCPYCGFDLTKTVCEECLKKVDLSLDTCPYCGNQLRREVIVPVRLEKISDERYKILETKEEYTVLKENDITLEKYRPVSLEDFFYTSQGVYYDVMYINGEERVPVLLPSYPVTAVSDYWSMLKDEERISLIFSVVNLFLKHQELYIAPGPVLFDADGRLIVNVKENADSRFLSAVAWLKEFLRSLKVDEDSFFFNIINSEEFEKIKGVNELVNFLYASLSSFSKLEIESFAITSQGVVRGRNEDNYVVVEYSRQGFNGIAPYCLKAGLFIVSDGMGGHRGGEEASRLIVKVVSEEILAYLTKEHVFFDLGPVINRAIARANAVVYQKNIGASTEREKMGATVAGILVTGEDLWYFNLGDSPIMLFDGKSLLKVSTDDVMLTNKKALTQAVGVVPFDKLVPHISKYKIDKELKFLICSDGLTDLVKFSEIEDALKDYSSQQAAKFLLSLALERGGIDNVTIVTGRVRRNKLF